MSQPPAPSSASGAPFLLGSAEPFEALREMLRSSRYTVEAINERMGIPDIHSFVTLRGGREGEKDVADGLDVLIRLFLDGERLPRGRVEELLPSAGFDALEALGLIRPHPDNAMTVAATVQLYPIGPVYVVSDLSETAPGVAQPDAEVAADRVYPALTTNTRTFLRMLPRTPCERFLELCAGTGIAALLAAATAKRAWAADITERATRFAEFNALLNGIYNFEAVRGDLYEPVAGLSFDRIVAHPPYLPAAEQPVIFAHSGEDGEDALRGLLAGLPDHLEPGGRFYCTCRATDRTGLPLEQRIRGMLGSRQGEFDVLLVAHYGYHPTEYYSRLAAGGKVTFAFVEQRHVMYRRHEVEQIVYCSFVVQRHASPRAPFTLRRERGEAWSAEVEWLLDWSTAVATGESRPLLLDRRLSLSPDASLHVVHRLEDAEWKTDSVGIRTERPFPREVESSTNMTIMLTMFDGSLTGRQALERLRSAGALPAEVPDEAFTELLGHLVTEGMILVSPTRE